MYANITASPADLKVQLQAFMDQHIYPNETVYHDQLNSMADRFQTVPLMTELKDKAREAGLWNLFMPRDHGGLSNADYAPLAEIMGRVSWSSEGLNSNAPDTGKMEVFIK